MSSGLLSRVAFASLFVYSPRGQAEISRQSRTLRDAVKRGDEALIRRAAELARGIDIIREFLSGATLVPCPRSAPLVGPSALWPGRLIAEALVRVGLGEAVEGCLIRSTAVPKSAFQGPGERPDAARHFATMSTTGPKLPFPSRLLVVDDFVTKGNTLLAAASRVQELFPATEVCAFALVRTLGLQPEIERMVEPCVGVLTNSCGEAEREP